MVRLEDIGMTTHPRPQLTRDSLTDLCGAWQFAYDDADAGRAAHWEARAEPFDRMIRVPFAPETELSGIGDKGYHPVLWYRLALDRPLPAAGRRLILHFGAVDYRADVWVNGAHVARHEGGHTPFSADITDALGADGRQVIVVRAEDRPLDGEQPRGKQDWQETPHVIWYHRTSGIWQPVWLEEVAALHVTAVHTVPDLTRASVEVQLTLSRAPESGSACEIRVTGQGKLLASQRLELTADSLRTTLHLPLLDNGEARGAFLWSPEKPNLIDIDLAVTGADGAVVDQCRSYFGMRSCGVGDGRFLLNGRPYFVRSVLEQGFWPRSHLTGPDDAALKQEVELIKALGFNAVRIHQKVEDPRFLYWCDTLGLLVWGEMPSAYSYSPRMAARFTREWLEVVERDRSHPCVVTWVPLNESWGVPNIAERADQRAFASALYHLTRAIDPTRPVISNDGWEHTISDIATVHDYAPSGAALAPRYADANAVAALFAGFGPQRRRLLLEGDLDPQAPVMVSEFGGISYEPARGEAWFGYATVRTEEDYLERLSGLFDALHESPVVCGYCYTQLTDTLQETNGLLDAERKPKLPIAALRALIVRPSASILAEALDLARREAVGGETAPRRKAPQRA